VFGAFLSIVGLTATGQALLVTADSSSALVSSTVGSDASTIRSFVTLNLTPTDLSGSRLTPERRLYFERGLQLLTADEAVLHIVLFLPDGTALAGDESPGATSTIAGSHGFQAALSQGTVQAEMLTAPEASSPSPLTVGNVLEEYFPILAGGKVYAVVGLWRDAAPIIAQLAEMRLHIVSVVIAAALVSLALLYFVFRASQHRLSRQTEQLLEATQRDALTGSLNHGALVEALTRQIAAMERTGNVGLGVALLDIDNLRSLNNTYGHAAGDDALLAVGEAIGSHLPEGGFWGRYGPDEFLVVAGGPATAAIEPAVEAIRTSLADLALTFDSSERLPLTISAGIAHYPTDARSVTSLLATTSVTLDEAKASGGDTIRIADAAADRAHDGAYDVLEGLVLAIDTKDRYTRRHSEDVARYATFLGEQLNLDADVLRSLYRAGRLHDVGKIGIPDGILRKPGALTDDEYAIVKQHVALGDLMTRDLVDEDMVRAGVRHHHERWDGTGYLHGLSGEDIPLVARILAVGDAFSAMTTTRPYRKALSVEEALRRLEDASGTQLDERLVRAFLNGIESAENPPMPGERAPAVLWTPRADVA
jgi:diguanylate cyclase (GGDEF)-like protein